MMADESANISLRLALDRSALQESATGIDKLSKSFADLKTNVQDTGRQSDQAVGKLSRLGQDAPGGGNLSLQGLRRTGGALSQLGLGGLGDIVGKAGDVAEVTKEVSSLISALGPLGLLLSGIAGAVVGLQVGLALLDSQLKDSKQALQSALDSQREYYAFAATATTADAERRKRELEKVASTQRAALNETEGALRSLEQQTNITRDIGDKLPGAIGEPFRQLKKQLDDNAKSVGDTEAAIGRLDGALKSGALSANDAAEKEQQLADARRNRFEKGLDDELAVNALIAAGSRKALQDKLDQNKTDLATINAWLEKNAERVAGDEDLAKTFDEAVAKAKALEGAINNLNRALSVHEMANTRTDSPELQDREARDKRLIDIERRFEEEEQRLKEAALQKEADIEQRYADRQIDIARQAADAAEAALRKLEEQEADAFTALGRDLEKAARDTAYQQLVDQTNAARDEAKAYRDHQHDLERIRKAAQDREAEMIQNRDFLGLFNSRRQTSRDIENANDNFLQQRQERQIAQAQQLEDLKRSAAHERQERLIAYQQLLVDARTTYQRQLVEARRKATEESQIARSERDRTLAEARAAATRQIATARSTHDQLLRQASLFGKALIAEHDRIDRAILARAEATLRSLSGGNQAAHHAGGGSLDAGDMTWVNERRGQRERFNGTPFPPGLGLFQAAQPGNVSAGPSAESGRTFTQNNTFNIRATDPAGTRREVLQVLHEVTR
jgi:hypothetical protein